MYPELLVIGCVEIGLGCLLALHLLFAEYRAYLQQERDGEEQKNH